MPQGEKFWNPYRMVPIRDRVERSRPVSDIKFTGHSGRITCALENLTLLFIGKNRLAPTQPLATQGRCFIPGSSLKGMMRSLAEIVGGGCFVTNHEGRGRNYEGIPGPEFWACPDNRRLCITCRMFGMMGRGQNARVLKGKVSISDALGESENQIKKISCQILLESKGAKHVPFYETPGTGKFDGLCRKIYFHQPARVDSPLPIPGSILAKRREFLQTVQAIPPGHHFSFEVNFTNLEDAELELLIYALALEEDVEATFDEGRVHLRGPMRHKIGLAKPLGFGSCKIETTRLEYFAPPRIRFSALQHAGNQVFEKERLKAEIRRLTQNVVRDNSPTMEHLRKMMVWDKNDSRIFEYPKFEWFRNSSSMKLKAI